MSKCTANSVKTLAVGALSGHCESSLTALVTTLLQEKKSPSLSRHLLVVNPAVMGATMGTAAAASAKLRQSEAGAEAEQERRGAEGETNTQHDMGRGEGRMSNIFVLLFVP